MIPPTPAPTVIVAPASIGADIPHLMSCIAAVERIRGSHRRGPCGERGKYQFTESTWNSVTSRPFSDAENDRASDEVCRAYLERLRYQMLERHIDPSAYRLALAFHAGLTVVMLHKWIPTSDKNYAERVLALYLDRT